MNNYILFIALFFCFYIIFKRTNIHEQYTNLHLNKNPRFNYKLIVDNFDTYYCDKYLELVNKNNNNMSTIDNIDNICNIIINNNSNDNICTILCLESRQGIELDMIQLMLSEKNKHIKYKIYSHTKYNCMYNWSNSHYTNFEISNDTIDNILNYESNTFDYILLLQNDIFTIQNVNPIFKNIQKWLKPTGTFICSLTPPINQSLVYITDYDNDTNKNINENINENTNIYHEITYNITNNTNSYNQSFTENNYKKEYILTHYHSKDYVLNQIKPYSFTTAII